MESNKYLIEEYPLIVLPTLAGMIGLSRAIILQQVHFWINREDAKIKNGRRWCYNTYSQWHKQFPFLNVDSVARLFRFLEKDGLIISANYNKVKMDKTKWYTINYDALQEIITITTKYRYGDDKMSKAIPYKQHSNCTTFLRDQKSSIKHFPEENADSDSFTEREYIKPNTFSWDVLQIWNSLDGVNKHKRTNTATCKKIKIYLNQLLKGLFGKAVGLSPEFIKKYKSQTRHTFTEKEIEDTVKRTGLYFKEGYFPSVKKNVPRSLSTMIFNPRAGTSWFLMAYMNPPKPLKERIAEKNEYKATDYDRDRYGIV